MKIIISADPYEPTIVESSNSETYLIEFGDAKLSDSTWNEFKVWHEQYLPYTDLKNEAELSLHRNLLEKLDNEGLNLTKRIAKEWKGIDVDKFFYFSYTFDYLVSIDRKGNESKIERPTRDDWKK